MSKYLCQRATEFDKQSALFKQKHSLAELSRTHIGQRKYDGCHMIAATADGKVTLVSRTGEAVRSCDHLHAAILAAFGNGFVIFGEAWAEGTPHPQISGDFRRHSPSPNLLFVVYDIVPTACYAVGYDPVPYRTRHGHLRGAVSFLQPPTGVILAASYSPGSYGTDPLAMANFLRMEERTLTGNWYDGFIMRDPEAPWRQADAKEGELIKVKPLITLDLRVVGVTEGLGKMAGMAGTLKLQHGDNVIEVGGGDYGQRRSWLDDPASIIGQIVEVEALEYTEEGALREPRLKVQRFDKLKAD